jgi:hypothetical protein
VRKHLWSLMKRKIYATKNPIMWDLQNIIVLSHLKRYLQRFSEKVIDTNTSFVPSSQSQNAVKWIMAL